MLYQTKEKNRLVDSSPEVDTLAITLLTLWYCSSPPKCLPIVLTHAGSSAGPVRFGEKWDVVVLCCALESVIAALQEASSHSQAIRDY